jgi:hypothetical protein
MTLNEIWDLLRNPFFMTGIPTFEWRRVIMYGNVPL